MKRTQIEILSDYMNGIQVMIDASSQMIHQKESPMKWIAIRDILHIIKKATVGKIDSTAQI